MEHFDVAIVGAGPAGSSAAIALARKGYSVALLDKEQFPREKLCGDFLNPVSWPLLRELNVERVLALSRKGHDVSLYIFFRRRPKFHCRIVRMEPSSVSACAASIWIMS